MTKVEEVRAYLNRKDYRAKSRFALIGLVIVGAILLIAVLS